MKTSTNTPATFLPSIDQLESMIQLANPKVWAQSMAPVVQKPQIFIVDDGSQDHTLSQPSPNKSTETRITGIEVAETLPKMPDFTNLGESGLRFTSPKDSKVGSPSTPSETKDDSVIIRISTDTNQLADQDSRLKKEISFLNHRGKDDPDYLSSRWDVVYKTILRDFRRYYLTMFRDMAGFTNRNKWSIFEETYFKFVDQIKNQHFPDLTSNADLAFHLGSLMCPHDIIKHKISLKGVDDTISTGKRGDKQMSKIYTVHDALYKFSIHKVSQLMKNQYYARLFRIYYDKLENGEIDFPDRARNLEVYNYAFKMLLSITVEDS